MAVLGVVPHRHEVEMVDKLAYLNLLQMARGKNKKKSKNKNKNVEAGSNTTAIDFSTTIVGVFVDPTTSAATVIEPDDNDRAISDIVSGLGLRLQNHINRTFGVDITIDSENAAIAGPSFALS